MSTVGDLETVTANKRQTAQYFLNDTPHLYYLWPKQATEEQNNQDVKPEVLTEVKTDVCWFSQLLSLLDV
jgi:hypothetical protein